MKETMGVLGPAGTHSEAAARYLVEWQKLDREIVCYGDIGACLHAVETGAVDAAFVPVEKSLEGAIAVTLDVLARSDVLRVQREVIWPVHNYLMARRADVEIRTIYSHAQPIAQCGDFLLRRYPQAELIKTASTARAAEMVGAAPLDANCTRFFEVVRAREIPPPASPDTILLVAQIDGSRPGALYNVLGEFARREVNLTRIESRPARTELGAYLFFFDLDAHSGASAKAIAAVARRSVWLKELGRFPVHLARNE